ncbi:hypothetical protein IPA_02615 [Ignicoccus pacificus DSM 13166]|uniref:MobA-like NTP transferase domain-containing protein n=1 Tax=Ignicoccus pacificus DSM 13166 TaxID=940294 RepID=A0A977KC87_9CREN|nr:hypothetical protein IPA_02615 [Ignicoccus pacificus DSM 13166]
MEARNLKRIKGKKIGYKKGVQGGLFQTSLPSGGAVWKTYVVLAGGESKRFGKDKLIALVDGRRVIDRVLDEIGEDHVLLTVSEERCKLYGAKRCLYDNGRGPAEALLALDGSFTSLSGDLPWIKREVLERLEAFRRYFGAQVAVPLHGKGFLESLMISVEDINPIKRRLKEREIPRTLRVTDIIRISEKVVFVGSKFLSRDPRVFAHVNTQEDLKIGAPKEPLGERIVELELDFHPCEDPLREVELYRRYGLKQMELHALKDLRICKGS